MSVTTMELKQNLDKYLTLAEKEDVYIARNGVVIARLTRPDTYKNGALKNLRSPLPAEKVSEEAGTVRMSAGTVAPLAFGALTKQQRDAEIQKGFDDLDAGRILSAEEVEDAMAREFGV